MNTHLSFDVIHVGIANSSGPNRRDAFLVCKSVAERIKVTNWNARCVSSRSLRRFSRSTRKDIVVGASIKYATIYTARWVWIYALISAILPLVSNHCEWFYQWKCWREFIAKRRILVETLWHTIHKRNCYIDYSNIEMQLCFYVWIFDL